MCSCWWLQVMPKSSFRLGSWPWSLDLDISFPRILYKASGTDEIKVRHHKGTVSFLGSRHLSTAGRRLNYSQLELFGPHMQSRRLQNPEMTMWLQKQNDQRLPIHIIQGHTFCPLWRNKKTCHYRRGEKRVGKLSGLELGGGKKRSDTLLEKTQAPQPPKSKIYCTFEIYGILPGNQIQGNGERVCTDSTIIWPTYNHQN